MAEGNTIQISLEEAKDLKEKAEKEIAKILSAFTIRTGLHVVGIGVESKLNMSDRVYLKYEL